MKLAAVAIDRFLRAVVWVFMHVAIAAEDLRRRLPRKLQRLRGSLRNAWRRWHRALGRASEVPPAVCVRRRTWNRTPRHIEEQIIRLHVEQPQLGAGQLARLTERVVGFRAVRETFRKIIMRRRDLIAALEDARRRRHRRIPAVKSRHIWGADVTIVWLLGVFPIWIFGVVDYHGSRLIELRRLRWPNAVTATAVLHEAFHREGAPRRLITDNDPIFRSALFQNMLRDHSIEHQRTRVAHPWTNGRIERLFRTFKSTVFRYVWLFSSIRQADRYCTDFRNFYNANRPHSSYGGLTPNEVAAGRNSPGRAQHRITYFDGRMRWWAFEARRTPPASSTSGGHLL